MKIQARIILLFIPVLFWNQLFSQQTKWATFDKAGNVTCLVTDDQFAWVGTTSGLAQVNRTTNEVITFNALNTVLPANHITLLILDSHGKKWIGTTKGLTTYDGTTWSVYDTSNSGMPENHVTSMAFDTSGNAWIGFKSKGFARFNGTSWKVFDTANSELPDGSVNAIVVDRIQRVWIGTKKGLAVKNDSIWTFFKTDTSFTCLALDVDSAGSIWAGTENLGIGIYNGNSWHWFKGSQTFGFPGHNILSITPDLEGLTWVGTTQGLKKCVNYTYWMTYTITNSAIPGNTVTAVAVDNNGVKWVGTKTGLGKYNDSSWDRINSEFLGITVLNSNKITCDSLGQVWFNGNTLSKYDGKKWTAFNLGGEIMDVDIDHSNRVWTIVQSDTDLTSKSVLSSYVIRYLDENSWITIKNSDLGFPVTNFKGMAFDRYGSLWLATEKGFAEFDGTNWIPHFAPFNIGNTQWLVSVDESNSKIIGGFGLKVFDGSSWKCYDEKNSIMTTAFIYSLAVDNYNNNWIGTVKWDNYGNIIDGGLYQKNGDMWLHYTPSNSGLPGLFIIALGVDHQQNLWIGLNTYGVMKFDGSSWISYTKSNSGLICNNVHGIAADKFDNIWISTDEGVSVFCQNFNPVNGADHKQNSQIPIKVWPNPVSTSVTISYKLTENTSVKIGVYDILGRCISYLDFAEQTIGIHQETIQTSNWTAGFYFIRLTAGNGSGTVRLVKD